MEVKMRTVKDPGLTVATNKSANVDGLILLHVRLGDLHVNLWFGVVTIMDVPLLLGTYFIDSFVQGIYPQVLKVVPFHYHPVSVVDKMEKPKETAVYHVE